MRTAPNHSVATSASQPAEHAAPPRSDAPRGQDSRGSAGKPVEMLLGGLVTRRVRVPAREVVFVKGVIEASEGVAVVFADRGGDLTIATLPSQKDELDRILHDLETEAGALLEHHRA
jgi:uncharacterized protein DUF4911